MALTPGDFWNEAVASVLASGTFDIPKQNEMGEIVPSPMETGLFYRSVGEPKGQVADYRLSLRDSDSGVHVVEFRDHYSIHLDRFDPAKHPVKHLVHDSPKTIIQVLAAGIIGALFFSFMRKK